MEAQDDCREKVAQTCYYRETGSTGVFDNVPHVHKP